MPTSSEPPSRSFATEANLHCALHSSEDHSCRSAQPLMRLLPLIATPLNQFGRIHLCDTREAMRDAVMRIQHGYCLVFGSPDDALPLGHVPKKQLAMELLTGNRPAVQRLVTITPCFPVSISPDEALSVLARKHAKFGVLCDLDGTAIGLCTRESLQRLAEDRP